MKTTNGKSIGKSKKSKETGKELKSRKVSTSKTGPTEEEIREKAREIYYERIARGEHGTAESDWKEAEELLRG